MRFAEFVGYWPKRKNSVQFWTAARRAGQKILFSIIMMRASGARFVDRDGLSSSDAQAMERRQVVLRQTMIFVALFGFAAAAQARPEQPKPVFGEKVAPAEVPQLIEMIRSEIKPGGRWEYVPKKDRPTLEARLDEMQKVLHGRASLDELSNDERLRLINAQEHVNAILTRHDGQRLICKRETPTGSHRPVNNCVTLAERNRQQEDSRRFLDDIQKGSSAMPDLPGPD